MKQFKTFLAWFLSTFGLFLLVYPRIAHDPFFPVLHYGKLSMYNPALIPLVYVGSYLSRAWGALLFAFMLGGLIAAFVPARRMKRLLSGNSFSSYFFAALFAPILTVCSCAMIPNLWRHPHSRRRRRTSIKLFAYGPCRTAAAVVVGIIAGLIYMGTIKTF